MVVVHLKIRMPGQVGRPSIFEERAPKFLEQIENCLPTKAAAALAGIDDNTVMRWLAASREQKSAKFINFFKCYTRARGIALAKMVSAPLPTISTGDQLMSALLAHRKLSSS
jgi:hypothetical protein